MNAGAAATEVKKFIIDSVNSVTPCDSGVNSLLLRVLEMV